MNDSGRPARREREPRRAGKCASAAALASLLALSCTSRAGTELVGVQQSALNDGGAPAHGEYSVVVVPELPVSPDGRARASFAFDAKAGVTVLAGGANGTANGLAETWTYDGAWTKKCDAASCAVQPAGRYFASLSYVPERGVNVFFGGVDGFNGVLCDTWEWETATAAWTAKTSPACGPTTLVARFGHAAAGFANKAVVFGGFLDTGEPFTPRSSELLAWDGQTWSRLCDDACVARSASVPAPRGYASLVHANLARGDTLLLFGGNVKSGDTSAATNDLWEFDVAAARWVERCTAAPCSARLPPPRAQHGAVWDPVRGRLIVHGGCNGNCSEYSSDAWEYDPEAGLWQELPAPALQPLPEGRAGFGMAFDSRRRRVVEFGGRRQASYSGATVELLTRGGACASASECHTGVCQASRCVEPCTLAGDTGPCEDGYACNVPCGQPCQSCARVPGVCTAITSGEDTDGLAPESHCRAGLECVPGPSDAAGACKVAGGHACLDGADCATGFCSAIAPHVCIDATCNQPCQLPKGGQCVPRREGSEPPDIGCQGLRCARDGTCLTRCTSTGDCVPDHHCDVPSGECKLFKEPGAACKTGSECRSGSCANGVCCETECDRQCDECGQDGRCFQRSGRVPPLPERAPCAGAEACQGYCDGRSECVYPGESTECGAPSCASRDYVLQANACDGNGQCARKVPTSCGDYACNAAIGACFSECNRDGECRRGAVCQITDDGRGVCNAQGTACDGNWAVRSVTGATLGCDGYPCKDGECAYKECVPGAPSDCAPNYTCRAGRCEDDGVDGGVGRAAGDAGDASSGPEASSCGVARPGARGTGAATRGRTALLPALGAALFFAVRRRRAERVRIQP